MNLANEHNDDSFFWKAFIQGNDAAFTQLYNRYIRILYSYGLKMQPDPAVVEDAIQDLFVDLWRLRSRLRETDSVKFYLFRSLRRRLHQAVRPEELPMQGTPEDFDECFAGEPSIEQLLITAEITEQRTEQLQRWLDSLPARQQEALLLRYYQDFSYEEIGSLLTINEQSARNLVQKALHKLRQLALMMVFALFWHTDKTFFWE